MKKIHNEMPDAAASVSLEQYKKMLVISLIKMSIPLVFCTAVFCLASMAWFTMNRETSASGMSIKTADSPFELKALGSGTLYDGKLKAVATDYVDGVAITGGHQTSGGAQSIVWDLTSSKDMNNVRAAGDEKELSEITKLESDEYGLSPGDYGIIEFSIVPKSSGGNLNIKLTPVITCYKAEYDEDGYETDDDLVNVSVDGSGATTRTAQLVSGHILLLYNQGTAENVDLVLLDDEGFDVTVSEEKTIQIYWVWPETLGDILRVDIDGLEDDADASVAIRKYLFENLDLFLERTDTPAAGEAAYGEMSNVAEANIATVSNTIMSSTRKYEKYSSWYNVADQTIGDEVSYITLEVKAEPQ